MRMLFLRNTYECKQFFRLGHECLNETRISCQNDSQINSTKEKIIKESRSHLKLTVTTEYFLKNYKHIIDAEKLDGTEYSRLIQQIKKIQEIENATTCESREKSNRCHHLKEFLLKQVETKIMKIIEESDFISEG